VRAFVVTTWVDPSAAPPTVETYVTGFRYVEGQWLRHQRFGLGRVLAEREGKVEVLFVDRVTRKLAADTTTPRL
jgi:hypothetical protein